MILKNDNADVGIIAYFLIGVVVMILLYICFGPIVDTLVSTSNDFTSTSDFPVSQARIDTIIILVLCFGAIPFVGILIPLAIYAWISANRTKTGGIH